jgi:hypothetical protein
MAFDIASHSQASSFDPVGILQQKYQNSLTSQANDRANADQGMQTQAFQNNLAAQKKAQDDAHHMEVAKNAIAAAQYVLASPAPKDQLHQLVQTNPGVADFVNSITQNHGIDWNSVTDDQVKQMAQGVISNYGSSIGQGPAQPKYESVAPGASLVGIIPGQAPSVAYSAPAAPITPYQQASLDTTRRGQDMTNQREVAKLKASTNPMGVGEGGAPGAAGVNGDAFLQTLQPNTAAQVKALAEGRMQFPSGFALKTPYWQQMLSAVSQYDPNFDQVNFNARSKTRSDFTSGKNAQNIKALNTAIGHLGTLNDQIDNTASGSLTPLNYLENKTAELTGSSGPTQFKQTAGALSSELTQVFRGSGGAEADVKRYLEELNVNGSKEQKKAAVQNIVTLLNSRLSAIGDQYNQGMGTTADPLTLLNPHAQSVLQKVSGAPAAAPSQTQNSAGWKITRIN